MIVDALMMVQLKAKGNDYLMLYACCFKLLTLTIGMRRFQTPVACRGPTERGARSP